MPEITLEVWKEFINQQEDAHILQTPQWAELKQNFGWQAGWLASAQAGAQILLRPLPLGFKIAYLPRGPVGEPEEGFWREVDAFCARRRAPFLIVEPDAWEVQCEQPQGQIPSGFVPGKRSIQPPRTIVVDLSGDDQTILSQMKQKTRYNVRLALRRGVIIRQTNDIPLFYDLVKFTGQREGFGVHSQRYYQRAYDLFHPRDMAELLLAEYEGIPLAALMVFANGRRAWYFYGASSDQHRDLMPTYLLQWEAMRWAKSRGCVSYDLYGVPDEPEEVLEEQFTQRSDGLWGVYRFKRGFGGKLLRSAGPWVRIYQPLAYWIYNLWAGRLA